jgi:hypothetical protein
MLFAESQRDVDLLAREGEVSDETRSASRLLDRDGIFRQHVRRADMLSEVGRFKKPIPAAWALTSLYVPHLAFW